MYATYLYFTIDNEVSLISRINCIENPGTTTIITTSFRIPACSLSHFADYKSYEIAKAYWQEHENRSGEFFSAYNEHPPINCCFSIQFSNGFALNESLCKGVLEIPNIKPIIFHSSHSVHKFASYFI